MLEPRPRYWFVFAMVTGLSSVLSCAWLFYTLRRRLAHGVRRRLFPRQLQSLAVAGFFFNIFLLPVLYIDLWTIPADGKQPEYYSNGCQYAYSILRTARFLSVLQQLHIALTFLAQAMRWVWALPLLNRAIPGVWLGGFALGVLDYTLSAWSFDIELNTCVEHNDKADLVSVCSISLCAAISILSFACTLQRYASSASGPISVRRKNYKRAAVYPAITVISYSGVIGGYMDTQLFSTPAWYWPVASILQASNGILNTLTFYSQSRYASRHDSPFVQPGQLSAQHDARGGSADFASWHVDFGGVDVIDIRTVSATSSESGGRTWRQFLHLPWDYDESNDAPEDDVEIDASTAQDLISISAQHASQLPAQSPSSSRGVSLQALHSEDLSGGDDANTLAGDNESRETPRECGMSTPGGEQRMKRRAAASARGRRLDSPEREAFRQAAADLQAERDGQQVQPSAAAAGKFDELTPEPEQTASCVSPPLVEQIKPCE